MCGIAGYVSPSRGVDAGTLAAMTGSLAHRGPDGSGQALLAFSGEPRARVGLGHRRLSILDLSEAASQPMSTPSGDLCLAFNGEIYNYVELRRELETLGHVFRSTGDTEVALRAYETWGLECFSRFNGMWGIVLFDRRGDRIVLSRDRFGEKPLHYAFHDGNFLFASEIKGLLRFPGFRPEPNYRKVYRNLMFYYGFVDLGDDTYFQGVRQLPKASYLVLDRNLTPTVTRYWDVDVTGPAREVSDAEAVAGFRELFEDSVKIRLRSDVTVGCMLSGGMDSTSTVAVASRLMDAPLATFSAITGEERGVYDESEHIDEVVRECRTDHRYVRPAPGSLFATVEEMLGFHDEPVTTVTWYMLYLIVQEIKKSGIKVLLTGHGGDELLAGYWDHYHYRFFDLYLDGDLDGLAAETGAWRRNHGRDPAELGRFARRIMDTRHDPGREAFHFMTYPDTFRPEFAREHGNLEVFRPEARTLELAKLRFDLDWTTQVVTRPEDRNTMAMSIESRTAFYDHRLHEYVYSLPGRFRIRDGLGKWLLRQAMSGILPEKVRTRMDKSGLNAPAAEWFRTVNRQDLLDLVGSKSFRERGIHDPKGVDGYVREHLSGQKNHHQYLWQLVNTELWMRRFFDR